jgi:hypothetical protein
MKRLSVVLLVITVILASCAINREKEIAKESMPSLATPKSLNDDWSKWLVGEWEGLDESDMGKFKDWVKGKGWMKIELCLNGQFLIMKGRSEITELSQEYIRYLKETAHASDGDIEKIRGSTFESLEFRTINPKTGEVIGYLFDSLRCIAKGKGKREANKEIMQWEWSGAGQGTSIRITEKAGDNKFTITEKYTLPDGSIMEDKREMTRKKITTEK